MTALEDELNSLNSEAQQLEARIGEAGHTVAGAQDTLRAAHTRRTVLARRQAESQRVLAQVEGARQAFESGRSQAEAELVEAEQALERLEDSLRAQLGAGRRAAVDRAARASDRARTELTRACDQLRAEVVQGESRVADLDRQVADAGAALEAGLGQMRALPTQTSGLASRVLSVRLAAEAAAQAADLAEAAYLIDELRAVHAELTALLATTDLDALHNDIGARWGERQRLVNARSEAAADLDQLRHALEVSELQLHARVRARRQEIGAAVAVARRSPRRSAGRGRSRP